MLARWSYAPGRGLGVAALCLGLGLGVVRAQDVVYFNALDAGVRPGDLRPNSDAAASAFDSAAGQLGKRAIHLLDFETVELGLFLTLTPAQLGKPGVSILPAAQSDGTDTAITDQLIPVEEGFNTTAGGSRFLKIEEAHPGPGNEPPVGITFDFATPIVAFGAYFTMADPEVSGSLITLFSTGQAQALSRVDGSIGGGSEFWGFTVTDPNAAVSSVTILVTPEQGISTDAAGLDDVRWVYAPEPGLASLLLSSGLILMRRRR